VSSRPTRLSDPDLVAREYASEERFLARRVVFRDYLEGPNAEDLAFEALREAGPGRVLEIGCGPGHLSERVRDELGAEVFALDVSPRMVELAHGRGLEALVGDVQRLPFDRDTFDCAVANWVLHHVPDLDGGLTEIRRVLRPGGSLVAATFGELHLIDPYEWLGDPGIGGLEFSRENGAEPLRRHFEYVEQRDADAVVVFPDREAVRAYLAALIRGRELAERLPHFTGSFRARSCQAVFIAKTAA
jgi:SAM-dependent methyltransferase